MGIWLLFPLLLLAAGLLLLLRAKSCPPVERGPLAPQEAADLLRAGRALLIDLRDAEDFEELPLPGAVNLPLSRLREEVEGRGLPAGAVILLCCQTGHRSRAGALLLRELGFGQVFDLGPVEAVRDLLADSPPPVTPA